MSIERESLTNKNTTQVSKGKTGIFDTKKEIQHQTFDRNIKMPKIDTLDALDDEMTSILNTL